MSTFVERELVRSRSRSAYLGALGSDLTIEAHLGCSGIWVWSFNSNAQPARRLVCLVRSD